MKQLFGIVFMLVNCYIKADILSILPPELSSSEQPEEIYDLIVLSNVYREVKSELIENHELQNLSVLKIQKYYIDKIAEATKNTTSSEDVDEDEDNTDKHETPVIEEPADNNTEAVQTETDENETPVIEEPADNNTEAVQTETDENETPVIKEPADNNTEAVQTETDENVTPVIEEPADNNTEAVQTETDENETPVIEEPADNNTEAVQTETDENVTPVIEEPADNTEEVQTEIDENVTPVIEEPADNTEEVQTEIDENEIPAIEEEQWQEEAPTLGLQAISMDYQPLVLSANTWLIEELSADQGSVMVQKFSSLETRIEESRLSNFFATLKLKTWFEQLKDNIRDLILLLSVDELNKLFNQGCEFILKGLYDRNLLPSLNPEQNSLKKALQRIISKHQSGASIDNNAEGIIEPNTRTEFDGTLGA